MNITTIDVNQFPRGMAGTVGKQENHHVGNFGTGGHSLSEWDT